MNLAFDLSGKPICKVAFRNYGHREGHFVHQGTIELLNKKLEKLINKNLSYAYQSDGVLEVGTKNCTSLEATEQKK